jgi:hypothetical protein
VRFSNPATLNATVTTTVQVTSNLVPLAAPPAGAVIGQQYYDTTLGAIGTYTASGWEYLYIPNPAGRVYVSAGLTIASTMLVVSCSSLDTDFMTGGMTPASGGAVGLFVPAAGIYRASWQLTGTCTVAAEDLAGEILNRTTGAVRGLAETATAGAGHTVTVGGSDLIPCAAGDEIYLYGMAALGGGGTWTFPNGSAMNYFSAERVS